MKTKKKVAKTRGAKTITKKLRAKQYVIVIYRMGVYWGEKKHQTDRLIEHYVKKFNGVVGGSGACEVGRDNSCYFTWQNDLNKFVKFMKTKKQFTNREPIKGNVPTKFKVKVYDKEEF